MKVLSLTEPYATLIKEGKKKIETRSWKTSYRGELYIHASLTKITKELKNNKELMGLVNNLRRISKIMELWEVLDDEGNPTGEIMEKYDKRVFDRNLYHLGTDVWIINSDNKILIQKRTENKRLEPNVWAMTGGSVIVGENSLETIVREAKEELDVTIDPNKLKLITKFRTGNVWIDTYILKANYDISKMKFQKEEVSNAKWATWNEIDKLVKEGKFIKHRWEFVKDFLKKEINE